MVEYCLLMGHCKGRQWRKMDNNDHRNDYVPLADARERIGYGEDTTDETMMTDSDREGMLGIDSTMVARFRRRTFHVMNWSRISRDVSLTCVGACCKDKTCNESKLVIVVIVF